ncbi:hypothetical protein AAFC00_002183 [Neodothiora populina]|uniref:EKC/KEOPS complex subunit GON7 n=1 Tax=Neodothiora populina TaxID=2781224 RepID=A0ABR3PGM7_9PEZI
MSTPASLTASYASSTTTQTFALALPSPPTADSVTEKTAFICSVRSHVSQMQDDINGFLTEKMEEDKLQEAVASLDSAGLQRKKKASQRDEKREEEMYGEEDVGEE